MVRLTTYRINLRANARTLVTDKTLKRSFEKLDFHDTTNYRHFIAFKRHLVSSRRCECTKKELLKRVIFTKKERLKRVIFTKKERIIQHSAI